MGLLDVCEPSLSYHVWKPSLNIVGGCGKAVEELHPKKCHAHQRILGFAPVCDMEFSTWLKKCAEFLKGTLLVVGRQVVEDKTRDDAVK